MRTRPTIINVRGPGETPLFVHRDQVTHVHLKDLEERQAYQGWGVMLNFTSGKSFRLKTRLSHEDAVAYLEKVAVRLKGGTP